MDLPPPPSACAADRACARCGNHEDRGQDDAAPFVACSACRFVIYCSRRCQLEDWVCHGPRCDAALRPGGVLDDDGDSLSFSTEEGTLSADEPPPREDDMDIFPVEEATGHIQAYSGASDDGSWSSADGAGGGGGGGEAPKEEDKCPICLDSLAPPFLPPTATRRRPPPATRAAAASSPSAAASAALQVWWPRGFGREAALECQLEREARGRELERGVHRKIKIIQRHPSPSRPIPWGKIAGQARAGGGLLCITNT